MNNEYLNAKLGIAKNATEAITFKDFIEYSDSNYLGRLWKRWSLKEKKGELNMKVFKDALHNME